MKKIFLVVMLFSSFLYSTVHEDAEDGSIKRWEVSLGATVSNVLDKNKKNKVIQLNSNTYKYYSMDNLVVNSDKKIKWDIKVNSGFIIYVYVSTLMGDRLLYYTILKRDYGVTSSGIHHGLGEDVADGAWHTITRDLEVELKEFEPNNQIIAINSFKIRATGDVFIDNIASYGLSVDEGVTLTRRGPHVHANCLGYIEKNGIDLNGNGFLDDNEIISTLPYYVEETPITRDQLEIMISSDEDITGVNTCEIENMAQLFRNNTTFNQDIGDWNVGSVSNMDEMFRGAIAFNQDIGSWNTTNVINMGWMFHGAIAFNQDIGSWDVLKVKYMDAMFYSATAFNQDIGSWNTDNVVYMDRMFYNTKAFDQDIGSWDVSKARDMAAMFSSATAFNQDISGWNVANGVDHIMFSSNSVLQDNYNPLF